MIKEVEKDVLKSFDLVTFLRRLRQHGTALNLTLSHNQRKIAGMMATSRPIEYIDTKNMKDEWFINDSFSIKDKLRFWVYKKFLEILQKENKSQLKQKFPSDPQNILHTLQLSQIGGNLPSQNKVNPFKSPRMRENLYKDTEATFDTISKLTLDTHVNKYD